MIINGIKGVKEVISGITGEDKEMNLVDTILTGLMMLKGEEGIHYVILERSMEGWERFSWLNRN